MTADRRLRVLVVAYYFPPMGLSGVQRIAKLVKYLPANGIDVTVLTVQPGAYFAFDPSLESEVHNSGAHVVQTRSIDPTQLFGQQRTVELPPESRRSSFSRLSEWFFQPDNKIGWYPFAMRTGTRLLNEEPHDLVFATAPPYTALLVGSKLAKRFSLPLVVDFRDDWVGNPRHTYPTRLHKKWAFKMEASVLQSADGIHVINDVIEEQLSGRHPGCSERLNIVPQGFDPADFVDVPHPNNVPKGDQRQASKTHNCTFLYTGIFYDAQRPDTFLQAFAAAAQASTEFKTRARASFVGLVPAYIHEMVRELGIESCVSIHGYLDHAETIQAQKEADILWLTIGRRSGSEGISTGKLYEYLGAGKPILGLVPQGVARQTLEASQVGFISDPDSVEEASVKLLELFKLWKQDELPGPAPSAFLKTYDRSEQARQMAHIFQSLVPLT